jgi:hypothetical protein
MTTRPPVPSTGDNFRRLPPEDEARLLREWRQTEEDMRRRGWGLPGRFIWEPR